MSSHPAFFLQPCHVSTIGYYLATVIPSEFSFIAYHGLTLLTWGPSLAFCFPNLPETKYEVLLFWLQHVLLGASSYVCWMGVWSVGSGGSGSVTMMLAIYKGIHLSPTHTYTLARTVTAPLFAVNKWHRPLYRSWSWNYFSFIVLSAYHWLMLLPWGILTGINVATMLSPPPALVPFGRAYRPVQGAACFVLHSISVGVHLGLSALVERRGALVRFGGGGGKAGGKVL